MKPTPVMAFADNYAERVKARLVARTVVTPGGCWEWTGRRDRDGYGRMKVIDAGVKRETGAHRAAWIAYRGAISDAELQTDHLCRVRHCVNPDHMELVTNQVNSSRADHSNKAGRSGPRPRSAAQKRCGKHGRADGYIRTSPSGEVRWICRPCRALYMRRWRRK